MLSGMLFTRRSCRPLIVAATSARAPTSTATRSFTTQFLRRTPSSVARPASIRSPLALCPTDIRFKSKRAKKDAKKETATADTAEGDDEPAAEVDMVQVKANMVQVITQFAGDLKKVRVGRLQPDFLDHLWVNTADGEEPAQLSDVAQISVKSPRLAVVTCFDPANVKPTQLAIRGAPLGLNPELQANNTLHIKVPAETKESRQELVKLAHSISEKAKRHVAEVRRKEVKKARGLKGAGGVSKDDIAKYEKDISTLHDSAVSKITSLVETKEKELVAQ